MKKRLLTIIGIVLMAAALFTVIHFIWSDLYIAQFDADNAEAVMWAQDVMKTGKLLDTGLSEARQLIPVGGNLFFVPFVKAFGVSMTALRAGHTALAVIFAALLALVLRALLPSWELAMIGSGLIMIFTTATTMLRSIIWAHSVYYSISVYFILMCIGSLALYLRGKRVVGGILFFFSALLCSINGNVVLLYTSLPLVAAIFLESMNRENPSEGFMKGPFLLICAAIVSGVVLNRALTSGVQSFAVDYYQGLAPASGWLENLRRIPESWLEIFLDLPDTGTPVMSSVGIKLVLRLGTALVLSVLPFFSFAVLKDTESRLTRIVIWYHWILCALVLFVFIFGTISDYGSRRLIPLWFSCLLVDWLTMVWMLKEKGYMRTIAMASICLMMMFAGMTAVSVTRKPADLSFWYGNDAVYNILETRGLTHGYSTNFWYTNSITLLSESRINVLGVDVTEDGFKFSDGKCHEGVPFEGKTFLVCWERDYFRNPWLSEDAVEVVRSSQYWSYNGQTDGLFILFYDRDVIAEKLQDCNSGGDAGERVQEN